MRSRPESEARSPLISNLMGEQCRPVQANTNLPYRRTDSSSWDNEYHQIGDLLTRFSSRGVMILIYFNNRLGVGSPVADFRPWPLLRKWIAFPTGTSCPADTEHSYITGIIMTLIARNRVATVEKWAAPSSSCIVSQRCKLAGNV